MSISAGRASAAGATTLVGDCDPTGLAAVGVTGLAAGVDLAGSAVDVSLDVEADQDRPARNLPQRGIDGRAQT